MRKFEELTDEEIVKLTLIANRNSIDQTINVDEWDIERDSVKGKIRTIYVNHKSKANPNKIVFDMTWGGFIASLQVPGSDYHYSLVVPFHEFLDYLDSINVDYRN